ncbi:MAG: hypothetical protein INR66_12720 [Gordonia polyisoprenivorans]|nr:hypothetical protein [Gordonia polyisoprenivorans]
MGLYSLIGIKQGERQRKADMACLRRIYDQCEADATAEVARCAALVREAQDDDDQTVRFFDRLADLNEAIDWWHHTQTAESKLAAMA